MGQAERARTPATGLILNRTGSVAGLLIRIVLIGFAARWSMLTGLQLDRLAFANSPVSMRHAIPRHDSPISVVDSIRLVPFLIVPVHRNGGKKLNTTKILQERVRSAFAPAAEPAADNPDPNELARSAKACLDFDLAQRIAAIRNIARGRIVFTTSFGIEDQAVTHAICSRALAIDVVTLDTGWLFPQTYELWAQTERRYGRHIQAFYPERGAVEALVGRQGINGFYTSVEARHACCAVRKVEPLRRALAGATAWITGLRADQSDDRAGISFAAVDPQHRLIKVNRCSTGLASRCSHSSVSTAFPTTLSRTRGSCRSAAPHARAPSRPANRSAPDDGGGRTNKRRECGLHHRHRPQAPAQSEASREEATP